jgi:GT2 family glycosyltransferase
MYRYNNPEEFRVIVIDQTKNGFYDKVKDKTHLYIRPKVNLGFSKSMNEGIVHALHWKSDYVILCNDDIEFINRRWWDGIMEVFNRISNAMVVNPGGVLDRGAPPRIPYKETFSEEDYDKLVEMGHGGIIDGICMWMPVFPRKTLEVIGPLDEEYFPGGGEDYDYNARIFKYGGRALGTLNSWVWHWWGSSKTTMGVDNADEERYNKPVEKQEPLPPFKETWNSLSDKWPNGKFDIYNPTGERGPIVTYHL